MQATLNTRRGPKRAVALAVTSALALGSSAMMAPAAFAADDAASTLSSTSVNIVDRHQQKTAQGHWTKSNDQNRPGLYEIATDADKGSVLNLASTGGTAAERTQARLLHYFESGAFPGDAAATTVSGDPDATIPLDDFLADGVDLTYKSGALLGLTFEVYFDNPDGKGGRGYTSLRENLPVSTDWSSVNVGKASSTWHTSGAIGPSNDEVLIAKSAAKSPAEILTAFEGLNPRVMSVGFVLGTQSTDADATIADISFLGQKVTFDAAPVQIQSAAANIVERTEQKTAQGHWTKANDQNLPGVYDIVANPVHGAALFLSAEAGPIETGTQARLLHYFDSGAFPADAAAVTAGPEATPDPDKTIPLADFLQYGLKTTITSTTATALTFEVYFDSEKDDAYDRGYTSIRAHLPANAGNTVDLDPSASYWQSSRSLPGISANTGTTLDAITTALAGTDPRVMSVGFVLGRNGSGSTNAAQIADVTFLNQTVSFALTPAPIAPTEPSAPAAPAAALVGTDGVKVSWAAPTDGGSAITGYSVFLTPANGNALFKSTAADATSTTFTNVAPGTYTATVKAVNAVGISSESAASSAVTITVPKVEVPEVEEPKVEVPEVEKVAVAISTPFLSKTSQVYGSKSVGKATVFVFGAKSGKVTFYNGKTKLGTATVKNHVATLKFAKKLKAGSYSKVVAKISATSTTTAATSPAAKFKVTKAKLAKKATVTGKSFKKGAKPKVTVKLGKLNNGAYATGKVKVYVGKKVVRTVTVKAKHKGKITVTLPKSKKSVKVKAAFQGSKNVAKSTSKAKTIKVKK